MNMPSGTTMAAGSSPTGSAMNSSMSDMMGMGGSCQISMLWNWNVIDACFISESWQIKSKGMFAGSCIGVILLVMALEFLRRLSKEYDRFIIKQHAAKFQESSSATVTTAAARPAAPADATKTGLESVNSRELACPAVVAMPPFRPSVLQQAVRALIHMVQFAVAYFVMLLAMYYNGYFIICIFIGAYLGSFIFQWETLSVGPKQTSAANEATVCCG